jgi:hypothetical protein
MIVEEQILSELNERWSAAADQVGYPLLKAIAFKNLSCRLVLGRTVELEAEIEIHGIRLRMLKTETMTPLLDWHVQPWECRKIENADYENIFVGNYTAQKALMEVPLDSLTLVLGDTMVRWVAEQASLWEYPSEDDPFNKVALGCELRRYVGELQNERDRRAHHALRSLLAGNINEQVEPTNTGGLKITLASGHILHVPPEYRVETPNDMPKNVAAVLFEFDPEVLIKEGRTFEDELNWLNDSGISASTVRTYNVTHDVDAAVQEQEEKSLSTNE